MMARDRGHRLGSSDHYYSSHGQMFTNMYVCIRMMAKDRGHRLGSSDHYYSRHGQMFTNMYVSG